MHWTSFGRLRRIFTCLLAEISFLLQCTALGQHSTVPGTVVTWGRRVLPYVDPSMKCLAASAGLEHNLAITDHGQVVAWGKNDSGECDVPFGLTDVTYVAAGT